MVDILHRIAARNSTPEAAYTATATLAGIRSWWIGDGRTDDPAPVVGTRFPIGDFEMEFAELRPAEKVSWRVNAGPDEWVGTTIEFDIRQDDEWTVVLFGHRGWREPIEFMHHCSTKWGVFMLSLKALLETGTGRPTPNDPHIDNWA
jgi:hypothetical protein